MIKYNPVTLNYPVHAPLFPVIDLPLTDPLLGVSDLRELRVESRERRISDGRERRVSDGREPEMSDGLEQLYRALEQANLTALGDPKPCSRQELRRCFTQRARDPLLNDRLHRVRALRSTLKVSANPGVVKRKCVKIPCGNSFMCFLSLPPRPKSPSWQSSVPSWKTPVCAPRLSESGNSGTANSTQTSASSARAPTARTTCRRWAYLS